MELISFQQLMATLRRYRSGFIVTKNKLWEDWDLFYNGSSFTLMELSTEQQLN